VATRPSNVDNLNSDSMPSSTFNERPSAQLGRQDFRIFSAVSGQPYLKLSLACLAGLTLLSVMGIGKIFGRPSSASVKRSLTARYAPRDPSSFLFFVGQDLESIDDYYSNVEMGSKPCGVTTYTTIQAPPGNSLHGLDVAVDYGAGTVHAKALLDRFPHSMLAIGLDIVDRSGKTLRSIANGSLDHDLNALGDFIVKSKRPVFLRIGYEFDGPWNHYDPAQYIAAFRKIVLHLRNVRKVPNFVSVWQSATSRHGTYLDRKIMDWWPGEDVVDWLGSSYFEFHPPSWNNLVAVATLHSKPVLICESAPQGYDLGLGTYAPSIGNGENARRISSVHVWKKWYAPFFEFVRSNGHIIRGVAYINCHWKSQAMWSPGGGNGYWGDSRVSVASEVKSRWESEMQQMPTWLHASNELNEYIVQ
jgi:hypothetical protein